MKMRWRWKTNWVNKISIFKYVVSWWWTFDFSTWPLQASGTSSGPSAPAWKCGHSWPWWPTSASSWVAKDVDQWSNAPGLHLMNHQNQRVQFNLESLGYGLGGLLIFPCRGLLGVCPINKSLWFLWFKICDCVWASQLLWRPQTSCRNPAQT